MGLEQAFYLRKQPQPAIVKTFAQEADLPRTVAMHAAVCLPGITSTAPGRAQRQEANMSNTAPTPVEVTETDPLRREINKGLMVAWINRDLVNRAGADIRKSIVLYDADGDFMHAFPACFEPRPGTEQDVWEALYEAGVRFWSKGIV